MCIWGSTHYEDDLATTPNMGLTYYGLEFWREVEVVEASLSTFPTHPCVNSSMGSMFLPVVLEIWQLQSGTYEQDDGAEWQLQCNCSPSRLGGPGAANWLCRSLAKEVAEEMSFFKCRHMMSIEVYVEVERRVECVVHIHDFALLVCVNSCWRCNWCWFTSNEHEGRPR